MFLKRSYKNVKLSPQIFIYKMNNDISSHAIQTNFFIRKKFNLKKKKTGGIFAKLECFFFTHITDLGQKTDR